MRTDHHGRGESRRRSRGAVGLAVLWSQTSQRPINLASPKKQQAPVSVSRQRVMFYGTAVALVLVLLLGSLVYVLNRKKAELERLTEEKTELEQFFKMKAQDRANLEAYKEWEQTSIPWLDEIYDLTARYPNEVGFRVNQFVATTSAKKNAKDGFVGHISLIGITPSGKESYVHQLNTSMSRDSHVRASVDRIKGIPAGLEYQMKIDMTKQPAGKYDTHLILPRRPVAEAMETEKAETEADEP